MDAEIDRSVFRDLSYGLYIITSKDADRMNAQVVNINAPTYEVKK